LSTDDGLWPARDLPAAPTNIRSLGQTGLNADIASCADL
jgi:hypothetical protein